MRIEKKRDEIIQFRDLKQGDAFVLDDAPPELLMKTSEIDEMGTIYNCVKLNDGKMYAVGDMIKVEKVDAYIVQ